MSLNIISHKRVIDWMTVIRNTKDNYRILENFWASQIESKFWVLEKAKTLVTKDIHNIFIFGGWYGILAQILVDNIPDIQVTSIDIDPACVELGNLMSGNDSRIKFVTESMDMYNNYVTPCLVINTSTEHVTQEVYDSWWNNIPKNTSVIIQGNNYFSCEEHIRCSTNIEEFKQQNHISSTLFEGELDCVQFSRYMAIGIK
jgi:hypothetical protein